MFRCMHCSPGSYAVNCFWLLRLSFGRVCVKVLTDGADEIMQDESNSRPVLFPTRVDDERLEGVDLEIDAKPEHGAGTMGEQQGPAHGKQPSGVIEFTGSGLLPTEVSGAWLFTVISELYVTVLMWALITRLSLVRVWGQVMTGSADEAKIAPVLSPTKVDDERLDSVEVTMHEHGADMTGER